MKYVYLLTHEQFTKPLGAYRTEESAKAAGDAFATCKNGKLDWQQTAFMSYWQAGPFTLIKMEVRD